MELKAASIWSLCACMAGSSTGCTLFRPAQAPWSTAFDERVNESLSDTRLIPLPSKAPVLDKRLDKRDAEKRTPEPAAPPLDMRLTRAENRDPRLGLGVALKLSPSASSALSIMTAARKEAVRAKGRRGGHRRGSNPRHQQQQH